MAPNAEFANGERGKAFKMAASDGFANANAKACLSMAGNAGFAKPNRSQSPSCCAKPSYTAALPIIHLAKPFFPAIEGQEPAPLFAKPSQAAISTGNSGVSLAKPSSAATQEAASWRDANKKPLHPLKMQGQRAASACRAQ